MLLVLAMKELKVFPEQILLLNMHQQIVKSSPQKNKDNVSNMMDFIFRTSV